MELPAVVVIFLLLQYGYFMRNKTYGEYSHESTLNSELRGFHSNRQFPLEDPDASDFTYLTQTCKMFYRCWKQLGSYSTEFAFLTLGRCNSTGKDRFNPRFPETPAQCSELLKLPSHNYAFAVLSTGTEWSRHAVDQIVNNLQTMMQWAEMRNIPKPLDVYLFTHASPCRECTRTIANIKDTTVHVTWIDQYKGESAAIFYQNLETLFEKSNINVLWKVENDCEKPRSYQYELYKCLILKIKKVADCSDIKSDVAKFVNKFLYECITYFPSNKLRECKNRFLSKFAGKVDGDFKYHLMSCMQNLYLKTLGLPLNPDDPTWGSQNVTDLKGVYEDFCFRNDTFN